MLPDWPRASGPPALHAVIRREPDDFIVTEILDIALSGEGDHDWLWVEKIGANTAWVAERLANFARVRARDVGYSGLKDRHAVTRQWFSIPRLKQDSREWSRLDIEGVRVLEAHRHTRKLRRGAHRGNRFRIALRSDRLEEHSDDVASRLQCITEHGVPNYFGEQRFGRGGSTLALGRAVLGGKRMSRSKRSLGISALRSLEFNNALAVRVDRGTWNALLPGDMANLDGTGSVFEVDAVTPELERRCREMDIHPAGVLPAIESLRVDASWRAFRLRVADLDWEIADQALRLEFKLGRGSFATSVLREVARYTSHAGDP